MKNSEHNANSWAYHKFCTKPWLLNKWGNILRTTHQESEMTCRPLTISTGRIGEFSNWLRCRNLVGISRVVQRVFDMFNVLFTSDSNNSAVIALSEKNSSIVGPNVFPVKFFSFFFLGSIEKELYCNDLFWIKINQRSSSKCNMMQAQPTCMIQINYKNDHFDEIKKAQCRKIWMSFDCTDCNCTDLKMIKNFLFTTCVYLHFNFTRCLHTKNAI